MSTRAEAEDEELGERSQNSKALDADMSQLLDMGLQLNDIERLWSQNKGLDMSDVHEAGARLVGREGEMGLPVKRIATVGLEIMKSAARDDSVTDAVIEALRLELDEPPEHFRDPIMLTLMVEPVVVSSGHVFDRSTVYDEGGKLRFQRCPMSREPLQPRAYPLVYLRSELISFKLRRLDGILDALVASAPPGPPHPAAEGAEGACRARLHLLEVASQFLTSLGAVATYENRAAVYYRLRLQLSARALWPPLLGELDAACAATPPRGPLRALLDGAAGAARAEVRTLWGAPARRAEAAALARALLEAAPPPAAADGAAVDGAAADGAAADAAGAWLALLEALTAAADVGSDVALLSPCVARLAPPTATNAALAYWRLALRCATAAGSSDAELRRLALAVQAAGAGAGAAEATPSAFVVSGAGVACVNGRYARRGDYKGVALYVHEAGQVWLLRYRLPSGSNWWYFADKDQLDVNDGDYYRVRAEVAHPPLDGWGLAKDGVPPMPSLHAVVPAAPPAAAREALAALLAEHGGTEPPPPPPPPPEPPPPPLPVVQGSPVDAAAAAATPAVGAAYAVAAAAAGGEALRWGDCLEVRDTHGLWATARVMATLEHARLGSLLLVHFEGWSPGWLMWLSRRDDADRMRPLATCPGIGSRGAHSEATMREVREIAVQRIRTGHSWPRTGGSERTLPFREQDSFELRMTREEALAWAATQHGPAVAFQSCQELARRPEACRRVLQAALMAPAAASPAGPNRPGAQAAQAPGPRPASAGGFFSRFLNRGS